MNSKAKTSNSWQCGLMFLQVIFSASPDCNSIISDLKLKLMLYLHTKMRMKFPSSFAYQFQHQPVKSTGHFSLRRNIKLVTEFRHVSSMLTFTNSKK